VRPSVQTHPAVQTRWSRWPLLGRRPLSHWLSILIDNLILIAALGFALMPLLYGLLLSLLGPAQGPGGGADADLAQVGRLPLEFYVFAPAFLGDAFMNSLLISVTVTICGVTLAALSAYALARFRFPGDNLYMVGLAGTQFLPVAALYIPLYLTYLFIRRSIGVPLDSGVGVIVVYIGLSLPLAIWILRGFFQTTPVELEEQALIDGASRFQAFRYIVLPLVSSGLFATGVYIFMVAWDEMLFGSLLNANTLAPSLRSPFGATPFAAVIAIVTTLPIAFLFYALQKRFIANLTGLGTGEEETAEKTGRGIWKGVWVILPIIGGLLFLFRNTHESLWMDESFSMLLTNHSLGEVWNLASADVHPPLYYILLWVFRSLFGDSIVVARTFSALGALGLVLLGVGPLRRAAGDRMALFFTLFSIFMPISIIYAQEIRMYSWAAFFVTGMAVYLYLAVRDGRRADWVFTAGFTLAATYFHLFSLMAAFFMGLFTLGYLLLKNRQRLPAFFLAMGVPVLLLLPWLFNLYQQAQRVSGNFWIPEVTDTVIRETLTYPFSLQFFNSPTGEITAWFMYPFIGIGLYLGLRRKTDFRLPLLAVITFVATLGAAIIVSHLVRPILVSRYIMPVAGLLILGLAYGFAQLRKGSLTTLLLLLLILQLPQFGLIYQDRFKGPMTEVADYLRPNLGADDIFLHTEEHTFHSFAYYFPDHLQVMYLPLGSAVYSNLEVAPNRLVVSNLDEAPLAGKQTWLVTRTDAANRPAYREAAQRLGLRPIREVQSQDDSSQVNYGQALYFGQPFSWFAVILDHTP